MNILFNKVGAAAGVMGGGTFKPLNPKPVILNTTGEPPCAFSDLNGASVASANHHERGEGSSRNDPQKLQEEPSEGLLSAGMLTEGPALILSPSPSLSESLLLQRGGENRYQLPRETLEGRLPKVKKILGGLGSFVAGNPQLPPMGVQLEMDKSGVEGQKNSVHSKEKGSLGRTKLAQSNVEGQSSMYDQVGSENASHPNRTRKGGNPLYTPPCQREGPATQVVLFEAFDNC